MFNLSNAESRARAWKGWRTIAWMNWLSCGDTDFYFQFLRGEGEDSERGETKFFAGVTVKFTAQTTMQTEERQSECSQTHSKCEQEVSRQQCERQKCKRHQCEARSANANSEKETTRKRQQCECDKSAKVRSANATLVRSDKTPNWFKSCEAAASTFRMEFGFFFLRKKLPLSVSLFLSRVRVRARVGSWSSKNRSAKVNPSNSPNSLGLRRGLGFG